MFFLLLGRENRPKHSNTGAWGHRLSAGAPKQAVIGEKVSYEGPKIRVIGELDKSRVAELNQKEKKQPLSKLLFRLHGGGFEPSTSTTSRWHSPAELAVHCITIMHDLEKLSTVIASCDYFLSFLSAAIVLSIISSASLPTISRFSA